MGRKYNLTDVVETQFISEAGESSLKGRKWESNPYVFVYEFERVAKP